MKSSEKKTALPSEESKDGFQNEEENINNLISDLKNNPEMKEDDNFEESEKDRVYAK